MFKEIQNLSINCDELGDGEYVLILHGWGSNIELHRHMANLMAQKYKVIMPDMPGFGQSEEQSEPWSVDDYVDFILEYLKEYNPKKLILLGHSFGGRVIIKLCSRENLPFEIEKVILVDAAGVKPAETSAGKLRKKGVKAGKKLLSSSLMKAMFPDAVENLKNKTGSADYRAASPIMKETLKLVVNEDLCDLMPNVKCPTLLIWGTLDDATPISDAHKMESLMPEAALVEFPGCGHYSFLENQAQFSAVLASFLQIG